MRIGGWIARAAVVAALAAGGCGGDDSDGGGTASPEEDAAREVVETYKEAAASGDSARACAQLTRRAREETGRVEGIGSCEEAHEAALIGFTDEAREALANADFEVQVEGDTGTAEIEGNKGGQTVKLRREGGRWRIDDVPLSVDLPGP